MIAAGGRFHALALAEQLAQRKALHTLITFSFTTEDKKNIDTQLVAQSILCRLLDQGYLKLRLMHILQPSYFNHYKDALFDRFVAKIVARSEPIDIFVGWAHYVLNSIPVIKKKSKKLIIESGSCHILEQQAILQEAYNRLGLDFAPIQQASIEKMIQEYEHADYIVTPSQFAQNSFVRHGLPPDKILTVPCGANTSFFLQEKKEIPKKFSVIFVGLLSIRKGIHILLEAWKKASLHPDHAQLVLVGSLQKDLHHVLSHYTIPQNIVFYGATDRQTLKQLYASSSLLVLPSLEDGFGMVMGEAMASGLPIIATKNSGGPDIIDHGKTGFLLDAHNEHQLADTLRWCFENQEKTYAMGLQAQQQVDKLSWEAYGKNVYQMYQKILGET